MFSFTNILVKYNLVYWNLFPSSGGDVDYRSRSSLSEREQCTIKKSKTGTHLPNFHSLNQNNFENPDFCNRCWHLYKISYPSLWCPEKLSRNSSQARRGKMNLDHPRIIDVHNYRYAATLISHFNRFCCVQFLTSASLFSVSSIFTATWNVAGRSPPSNLNLDDLLHASPPADIYVLG